MKITTTEDNREIRIPAYIFLIYCFSLASYFFGYVFDAENVVFIMHTGSIVTAVLAVFAFLLKDIQPAPKPTVA
ncbi:hypothetical protein EML15_04955 [Corynebacterium sp. sy017]|nr:MULTISPECIES: hypothetical protein [unclassified Corynebacterium]MBP3088494.1 hypothetical protein [Corynebacterium sp. sy017]TSD91799.1 hypothetical protein ELY17_04955 [Corynebacterium sp. SY003]